MVSLLSIKTDLPCININNYRVIHPPQLNLSLPFIQINNAKNQLHGAKTM